jgi:hypothetical protein
MRARQVFNVSSSTPAAIRLVLELGWFLELGSATAPPDDLGLETAAPPSDVDVDDPLLDDSIWPSLAQPPTMSPNTVIHSALLNMTAPHH